MALFTFGEGYHNYHTNFRHDYRKRREAVAVGIRRNVLIWICRKVGLTGGLRRVPQETIHLRKRDSGLRSKVES